MATTLFAVVFVLILGHLAPQLAASVRRHAVFDRWQRWLGPAAPVPVWLGWTLGVPVLALLLLRLGIQAQAGAWATLLLDVAVLFWCWGPRDLDQDVHAVLHAQEGPAQQLALERLCAPDPVPRREGAGCIEAVFRAALRRWFAVLLWFCVAGPAGALLYRLTVLATTSPSPEAAAERARVILDTLRAVLEWPAVQLMVLALAIVGDVASVAAAWRQPGAFALQGQTLLAAAARACVRADIAEEVADYTASGIPAETAMAEAFGPLPELHEAMALVWRILLLWLTVLALFVVAGWVG